MRPSLEKSIFTQVYQSILDTLAKNDITPHKYVGDTDDFFYIQYSENGVVETITLVIEPNGANKIVIE